MESLTSHYRYYSLPVMWRTLIPHSWIRELVPPPFAECVKSVSRLARTERLANPRRINSVNGKWLRGWPLSFWQWLLRSNLEKVLVPRPYATEQVALQVLIPEERRHTLKSRGSRLTRQGAHEAYNLITAVTVGLSNLN